MQNDNQTAQRDKRTKAGLEPKEFQRRLIFVTVTVLILGVGGGTCLGIKIKNAEQLQDVQVKQETPQSRAAGEAKP